MKNIIKRITPLSVRSLIVRIGRYFANDRMQFPSQVAALSTLKSLGWTPSFCIDVGAYHGDWTSLFRSVFPAAKVLMIEGQEEKKEQLQEVVRSAPHNLEYAIALLGASDGRQVDFTEMGSGSSVFEEASPYPRRTKAKRLITLDSLLARYPGFQDAQFLKIDTQGYELEIMKGSSRLLQHVEVVLLEVSLVQINRNAPLFSEVVEFMASQSFRLFDFCSQIRRKDGVLWQTDLLFIREEAIPHLEAKLTEENWGS